MQRLREFAEALPNDLFHAVEFRDRSWLEENTYELLSEYGIALCVHDLLPRHPRRVTGTLVYVRFHGTGDKYAGSYRPSRLEGWAEWIQEAADQVPVFVYFNNDTHRHAVRNAESLEKLVFA